MVAIEVNNLSKSYEDGKNKKTILKSVNIQIESGKFVAIIGKSGSGKSTLLHILGGLDTADSGEVTVNGKRIDQFSNEELARYRAEDIGYVFQSFQLISVLSVYENIVLPAKFAKKEIDENYVEELMRLLEISDKKDCLPAFLSGGEQQRVAIARALVNKPRVVFADEPTGNLDAETGEKVLKLFLEGIRKYEQTLIMVTHDLDIAEQADVIIHIKDMNS